MGETETSMKPDLNLLFNSKQYNNKSRNWAILRCILKHTNDASMHVISENCNCYSSFDIHPRLTETCNKILIGSLLLLITANLPLKVKIANLTI